MSAYGSRHGPHPRPDREFADGSGSQTNRGAATSLGYQTGSGDLRAGVMSLDVGHASNSMGAMATAALSLAKF